MYEQFRVQIDSQINLFFIEADEIIYLFIIYLLISYEKDSFIKLKLVFIGRMQANFGDL